MVWFSAGISIVSPEVWVSQEGSDLNFLKVELKFDPPYLGSVRLYKHQYSYCFLWQ